MISDKIIIHPVGDGAITIHPSFRDYQYNTKTGQFDSIVYDFSIVDNNFSNCPAHTKSITAGEMLAIYEYVKNIKDSID